MDAKTIANNIRAELKTLGYTKGTSVTFQRGMQLDAIYIVIKDKAIPQSTIEKIAKRHETEDVYVFVSN